ncbi:MAG TPA: hypothetical protein ENH09_02920 [Bacteroidetes bacterium]|nr:hypothetical protein [Bacteroidota bacterium]
MEDIIQHYWLAADLKRRLLKLVDASPPSECCKKIFMHGRQISTGSLSPEEILKEEPVLRMIQQIIQVNDEILSINPAEFENFLRYRIQNPAATVRLLKIIFQGYGKQPALTTLLNQETIFLKDLLYNKLCEMISEENWRDFVRLLLNEQSLAPEFFKDYHALLKYPLELQILGYGEISTVMKPVGKFTQFKNTRWIYKRMPIFPSLEDVMKYRRIYREYRELLIQKCGLRVPEQKIWYVVRKNGTVSVYALQEMVNPDLIGHKIIHRLNPEQGRFLFNRVLHEIKKIWDFNQASEDLKIALDGQISNWALLDLSTENIENQIRADLIYLDTSTPLYRIDGKEQLDTEIFIKNSPSFLRAVIRLFFLQDVLDRYYDFRLVVIDLIANFYKEGLPQFIPYLVEDANRQFEGDFSELNLELLTEKEIKKYYKQDAFIWKFFQASRKIDKFIIEKIRHKRYEYRLPGKIKR